MTSRGRIRGRAVLRLPPPNQLTLTVRMSALPKDFKLVFDFDKPSDAKHAAALADAQNYIRALDHGIAEQDPNDPAYQFYSAAQAAQYAKSQIEAWVKGKWTVTGTDRYYDEEVTTLNDGKGVLVAFCRNQAKFLLFYRWAVSPEAVARGPQLRSSAGRRSSTACPVVLRVPGGRGARGGARHDARTRTRSTLAVAASGPCDPRAPLRVGAAGERGRRPHARSGRPRARSRPVLGKGARSASCRWATSRRRALRRLARARPRPAGDAGGPTSCS